LHKLIANF